MKITFQNDNKGVIVEISIKSLNKIKQECLNTWDNETGGILIGKYSEDRTKAIITCVTGPPDDSEQRNFSFVRGTNGLIKLLDNCWELGEFYLGEWHLHPNSSPQPSLIDDTNMKELGDYQLLNCPEPVLLIIGGNPNQWDISVQVYINSTRVNLLKNE